MTVALLRRSLLLAVALWVPTLLIATAGLLLEPRLLALLGSQGLSVASAAANAAATALVCLLFARRYPVGAWRTLAAALLIAYATALGLSLLLRIDVAATGIVLLVDAVLWLLAAVAGTALGLRSRR